MPLPLWTSTQYYWYYHLATGMLLQYRCAWLYDCQKLPLLTRLWLEFCGLLLRSHHTDTSNVARNGWHYLLQIHVHSFHSQHDPLSGSCAPGGSVGNFIMFRSATDGQQANNRMFSTCSLDSIRPVLQTKSNCFECKHCKPLVYSSLASWIFSCW